MNTDNTRRYVDVTKFLLGRTICSALQLVHAFTGYDYTSAFWVIKANVIQLSLWKDQLESRMLLSDLSFLLTCPVLQKSL